MTKVNIIEKIKGKYIYPKLVLSICLSIVILGGIVWVFTYPHQGNAKSLSDVPCHIPECLKSFPSESIYWKRNFMILGMTIVGKCSIDSTSIWFEKDFKNYKEHNIGSNRRLDEYINFGLKYGGYRNVNRYSNNDKLFTDEKAAYITSIKDKDNTIDIYIGNNSFLFLIDNR
jgi:hypothetical protein